MTAPASAQVGAALSVFSDDRLRGYSVSDGYPVGILDLSYDVSTGFYGALSARAVADDGVHPLSLQLNAGYATRVSSALTLDVGVVHTNYSHYSAVGSGRSYAEAYAGLAGKFVTSRVYFSPDYFGARRRTLYTELDGHLPPVHKITINAHAGLLVPISSTGQRYRSDYDWRLGVVRSFGRVSVQADWVNAPPPPRDSYGIRRPRHNALVFGLTWAL